jgi:hypothetical protein
MNTAPEKSICPRGAIAIIVSVFVLSVIATAQPRSSLRVKRAQSDSLFLPATSYFSGGTFGNGVAVGDLNHDGKPDIVIANGYIAGAASDGGVGVLLGNGDGSFQPAITYKSGGTGAFATSVTVADVTGDGKLDLVVTDTCGDSGCRDGGNWVAILAGKGDGTFRQPKKLRSGGVSWSVQVADLNRDGIPDLVVVNTCTGTFNIHSCKNGNGSVGVLLGLGKGKFQAAQTYPLAGLGSYTLTVGDFNGDGIPDVAATSFCVDPSCSTGGNVGILLGNGDGSFQAAVSYSTSGRANWVASADFNGDGFLDLVVANGGSDSVAVLFGNGNGTFQPATVYDLSGYAFAVAAGDVNQDGASDLLVATNDFSEIGVVSVLLGNGNGTFQSASTYSTLNYGTDSIVLADLNGDGRQDIVVGNECGSGDCYVDQSGAVSVLLHADNP